jgi:hypothetical protein
MQVKIIIVATDVEGLGVEGMVKAVDVASSPTIAFVKAKVGSADVFVATSGRHSYHFRVSKPGNVTLSTEIDGIVVGPPKTFDATVVTSGRRYNFEVPS